MARRIYSDLMISYIHSGVGLGNQKLSILKRKASNEFVTKRWRNTNTLIIDESKYSIRSEAPGF